MPPFYPGPSPAPAGQTLAATARDDVMVCIVDDEEPVRQSLCRLLRSAGIPARAFASAAEFLSSTAHHGPCCIVLDVSMPAADGFHLQQQLAGRGEQIVFLTGHGNVPMCARAMKAGAVDFLSKPVDEEVLLECISRALDRSRHVLETNAARQAAQMRLARLTARETAVMQRVILGMLNKQIAADLAIAEKTVKVHRGRIMRKLGVFSVPDLLRLTLAAGGAPPATASANCPP